MAWAVLLYFVIACVWSGFVCLLDTKLEASGRREPQLMKCVHEIHQWGILSIINQWRMVQLIERGAIPVLVALGSIRREAEQVIWSKPISSTPHGICITLSPGFCPVWISFWRPLIVNINLKVQSKKTLFSPSCFVVVVSITIESLTKTPYLVDIYERPPLF